MSVVHGGEFLVAGGVRARRKPQLWLPAGFKRRAFCAASEPFIPRFWPVGINRRDCLRYTLGIAAGVLMLGGKPRSAKALPGPVVAAAAAAFTALVAWFVNRALNALFPVEEKVLRVEVVDLPKPSKDDFHNSYASHYVIREYKLQSTASSQYGYHVALDSYLRADDRPDVRDFKDFSRVELRAVHDEVAHYGLPLFPCGLRRPVTEADLSLFRRTCSAYRSMTSQQPLDPDRLEVLYTRPFNDGKESFTSFYVANDRGDTDLLIEPKRARISS